MVKKKTSNNKTLYLIIGVVAFLMIVSANPSNDKKTSGFGCTSSSSSDGTIDQDECQTNNDCKEKYEACGKVCSEGMCYSTGALTLHQLPMEYPECEFKCNYGYEAVYPDIFCDKAVEANKKSCFGGSPLCVPIGTIFCADTSLPSTCPATYNPICGDDGKTHDNKCIACKSEIWHYTEGACVGEICYLVEPEVKFQAQRMFLSGTNIPTEQVRVVDYSYNYLVNGGYYSTGGGVMRTIPNHEYMLYFAENSNDYYISSRLYEAPCQDATDNVVAELCKIDKFPTIIVYDEYGNVQTTSANAQGIDYGGEVDITVRVKSAADKCFGNPTATGDNAICLKYDNTVYTKVETNTDSSTLSYDITPYTEVGYSIACYNLEKLSDREQVDLGVTIQKTTNRLTEGVHNIEIYIDDIELYVNEDNLNYGWSFQDEDNNGLGASPISQIIYLVGR